MSTPPPPPQQAPPAPPPQQYPAQPPPQQYPQQQPPYGPPPPAAKSKMPMLIGIIVAVVVIVVVLAVVFLLVLKPSYAVDLSQPEPIEYGGIDLAGKITVNKVDSARSLNDVSASCSGKAEISYGGYTSSNSFEGTLSTLDDSSPYCYFVDEDDDETLSVGDYFIVPYGSGNLGGASYKYSGTLTLSSQGSEISKVSW